MSKEIAKTKKIKKSIGRCEECNSTMTYLRIKDKKRVCRRCGHIESPKVEIKKVETQQVVEKAIEPQQVVEKKDEEKKVEEIKEVQNG